MTRPTLIGLLLLALSGCAAQEPAPPQRDTAAPPPPVDYDAAFARYGEARALAEKAEESDDPALQRSAAEAYLAAADAGYYMERALPNAVYYLIQAADLDAAAAVFERMAAEGYRFLEILTADVFAALHDHPTWPSIEAGIRENAAAYDKAHLDLDQVRIVADDVARFWTAFDLAAAAPDRAAKMDVYRQQYFAPGSIGLRHFMFLKIGGIDKLVDFVEEHKAYYEGVRQSTAETASAVPKVRESYRKMKELYPEATFSDIYFVIGRHTSFGTSSPAGSLIGAENVIDETTPLDGLPEGRREVVMPASNLHQVVAHEYVHTLQRVRTNTVLQVALVEGGADFIGELISEPYATPRPYQVFGRANDETVWRAFMEQKDDSDASQWSANSLADLDRNKWEADLAYYVGYQIAKGYYEAASDKKAAIRELLLMEDPEAILTASGYRERYTQ